MADSPGGQEVGRVSIRVVPDTSRFREELRDQLRAIRGDDVDIEGNLKIDDSQVRDEVRSATANLPDVEVDIVGQTRQLQDELRTATANPPTIEVPATVDESKYRSEVARLISEANANFLTNSKLRIPVAVEADRGRLWRELKGIIRGLRGQAKGSSIGVTVEVDVDQSRVQQAFASIRAGFEKLKAATAFKLDFGGGAGFGGGDDDPADKMEKVGSSAGRATNKILGLTRVGWLVVGVFAAMAPVIGLVAGLIAGLPSLLAAVGAGGAAVALGLDGIKAAASTLAPEFEALKAAVSGTFQEKLTPIFEQLRGIFPLLTTGMQEVATGLSAMFQGFTDVVTSAQGMSQLQQILSGIGSFFTSLQPVVASFTSSFLSLATSGANAFGTLLGPLQSFADGFADVVRRVTSNGVFEQAMTGMAQTLTGFFDLFNKLFESGLQAMGDLGPSLQNMFSGFGTLIQAAMPALTAFSGLIANTIGQLGTALAPAFQAIAGPITEIGSLLSGFLGDALTQLSPLLTQVATALGTLLTGALQGILPVLTTVVTALAGPLTQAMTALQPLMPVIAQAFAQLGQALAEGLALALPQITAAFMQLLPVIIQLIPPFLQVVQAVIPLIPAAFQLAAALLRIVAAVAPLIAALGSVVGKLVELAAKFASWGAQVVSIVVNALSMLVNVVADILGQVTATIAGWIGTAVAKFQEFGSQAISTISSFAGQMVSAGADLVKGLISGIGSMIGSAVAKARELASSVVGAVKGFLNINSPSKVFIDIGEEVGAGFEKGIANGEGAVVSEAKAMATAVFQAFKDVFGTAEGVNLNFNLGGMQQGMSAVQGQMNSLSSTATDFRDAVNSTSIPVQTGDDAKAQKEALDRQLLELEIQRKTLMLEKDKAGADQAAIRVQLDQIANMKTQLGLQRDQLNYATKYGEQATESASKLDQFYTDIGKKVVGLPTDFAKATGQQFMSDLGISGQGAIPNLLQEGAKYIFNVSGIGEAMTAQQTLTRRDSLQFTQR